MSDFFGRAKIYTSVDVITQDNILAVLNDALAYHCQNIYEEDYLYWYRRGKQPILEREKEIRPEINNKIVENIADEIVSFKNGYFLTKPAFYVSRKGEADSYNKINELNNYLVMSNKPVADNEVVDWFHTVGVAPIYIEANNDVENPCSVYSIDPRQAFVIYSRRPGNKPMLGVNMVLTGIKDKEGHEIVVFDCFSETEIFHVHGNLTSRGTNDNPLAPSSMALGIDSIETNFYGVIPIIEYEYNRNRMSAFENVIDLCDAINQVQSDRENGVEQFIQSLMILKNCTLGEDEDGNEITAQDIRQRGMIELKSSSIDAPADVVILSDQLDQSQTQVYIDDMLHRICDIAGIPFTSNAGTSDSSNNGAVYLRNGWSNADTCARNTEDLFRQSNKLFDKAFLRILSVIANFEIKASDIDIQFTRNEMENLLVKTQGALNLKQLGFAPELVLAKSGISNDPSGDYAKSKELMDLAFSLNKPQKTENGESNAENNNRYGNIDEGSNN